MHVQMGCWLHRQDAFAGARAGATLDHARAGASNEAKQAMQAEQAE